MPLYEQDLCGPWGSTIFLKKMLIIKNRVARFLTQIESFNYTISWWGLFLSGFKSVFHSLKARLIIYTRKHIDYVIAN